MTRVLATMRGHAEVLAGVDEPHRDRDAKMGDAPLPPTPVEQRLVQITGCHGLGLGVSWLMVPLLTRPQCSPAVSDISESELFLTIRSRELRVLMYPILSYPQSALPAGLSWPRQALAFLRPLRGRPPELFRLRNRE